jgi:outer membrane protein OmpA-like peptidoglycan-associated protein
MRSASIALLAALAAALGVACTPKHVASAPPETARTTVVLLPDADTAVTGRAFVTNSAGTTDLTTPYGSSTATPTNAPLPAATMTAADVQRLFGDALSALPSAAVHFTLYFKFESDELTDESRALLPQILDTVRTRTIPEVLVTGHTDTMGTPKGNLELGLTRANAVRTYLIQVGLDSSTIEVRSHGESDPVVKTPDETPEPRNRRVEISVR